MLTRLQLRDFRCFAGLELDLSPQANLISGDNASGKTSLLEAVFVLSRGRSFRSSRSENLVRHGAEGFLISGQLKDASGIVPLGLGRQGGGLEGRLGGAPVQSLAELTERLPVQLFDASAHQLIEGGPRYRRQFLDWGVFHVEPSFFPAWRRYQRALRQRNSLLRQRAEEPLLKTFEPELAQAGTLLDGQRRAYLEALTPKARAWAERLLGPLDLNFEYQRGWGEGKDLVEALAQGRSRDREQGSTQAGPHRAELAMEIEGIPAQRQVSRGQQKVLAGALLLAQAAYLKDARGRQCLLLLDDLAAELDGGHHARFLELVHETGAQVFLTSVEAGRLPAWEGAGRFHVEHGRIAKRV